MHDRIALIKTGWSEQYQGGPVFGRYAHIAEFDEAHERFNFVRHTDGMYYGYLPPIGEKERPPQPKVKDGWLLVFVSARNGNGPLTVVGWYDNATFHNEYSDRPEYSASDDFETDVHGARYGYCLSAPTAHLIPSDARHHTISGEHFKRSPVLYVRGNGKDDEWRQKLAKQAEEVVAGTTKNGRGSPKLSFPDPELRKRVELAAIQTAKDFLGKAHRVTDRQKDNCGYDLLARHKKTGEELHVEVKGTSSPNMQFYMSRNEFRYMPSPKWRLLIVTEALTNPTPTVMTEKEVRKVFEFDPFAWEARAKGNAT